MTRVCSLDQLKSALSKAKTFCAGLVGNLTEATLETVKEVQKALEKKADKAVFSAATLSADGWSDNTDGETKSAGYAKMYTLAVSGATEKDSAECLITPASEDDAIRCGVMNVCDVASGEIRFYAVSTPTAAITIQYNIIKGE